MTHEQVLLLDAVARMRVHQKRYVMYRDRESLTEAMRLEAQVDRALAAQRLIVDQDPDAESHIFPPPA